MDKLTINNLAVVEYKNNTDQLREWYGNNPYILRGEICTYKVFWGRKDDIGSFPGAEGYVRLREGEEAYTFLASVASGIYNNELDIDALKEESEELDTHDRNQFRAGYKKRLNDFPDVKDRMGDFVSVLEKDMRLVTKNWLSHYKKTKGNLVAADLSGLQKNDAVVLVASFNKGSNLSVVTKNIFHVLSTHRRKHASVVSITNPDADVLDEVEKQIAELGGQHKMRCDIKCIPFEEFPKEIERAQRVYVCEPMGKSEAVDQFMISSWMGRVQRQGTLTHLQGSAYDKGFEEWLQVDLKSFVSPECIRDQMAFRSKMHRFTSSRTCMSNSVAKASRRRFKADACNRGGDDR